VQLIEEEKEKDENRQGLFFSERLLSSIGLGKIKTVVFDCDGVLIDSSKSYDATICKVARLFASKLGFVIEEGKLRQGIEALRRTGGFNNDWDTTYALIQYLFAKASNDIRREVLVSLDSLSIKEKILEITSETKSVTRWSKTRKKKLDLQPLISAADLSGFCNRSEVIRKIATNASIEEEVSRYLGYPDPAGQRSFLAVMFDEIMYGSNLFREMYKTEPVLRETGLIMEEKLLIREETLRKLVAGEGGRVSLGIITGRPRVPTYHTLGSLMKFFSEDLCVFTGDNSADERWQKPLPGSLLLISEKAPEGEIVYVGDSVEDLLLTRNANTKVQRFLFFGVVTAKRSIGQKKQNTFLQGGADALFKSVNDILAILSQK
jgi:phosphoglycolate phosphatase-like HAD superfamily hydrolase